MQNTNTIVNSNYPYFFLSSAITGTANVVVGERPRYWFRKHMRECPRCGSKRVTRERMNTIKPPAPEDRETHEYVYDHCAWTLIFLQAALGNL